MKFNNARPKNDTALGGWKPSMLHGGIEVPVNYKTARKFGYYESSSDRRTLARRVELPEWVNSQMPTGSLLAAVQSRVIHIPAEHSKERQGHIFWNPSSHGIDCPAVGVDEEIYNDWISAKACEEVVFVVYLFDKKEVERWRVAKSEFVASCKHIQTSASFAAQMMIPVTKLRLGNETTTPGASFNNPFDNLKL
ncbi:MAG: hypothetical protein NTZ16_07840 [Verrucomicrobia bacterium]|nr:hypothetical protein [Verrucomicrobiota bacterium]